MLTRTLAVAALAVAPALAEPAVNVYWGQKGASTDRLRTYCDDSSFEYVTIGFINQSPQQDASNLKYPGSDFAVHCMGEKYRDSKGVESKLLSHCGQISADVRYCQKKGKKVLLSIGGEFSQSSNYTVSSPPEGEYFANFLWNAFGPYNPAWKGARPFDDNYAADVGDEHFVFDGFDFDIEHKFADQSGYVAMARRLYGLIQLNNSKKFLLTAAPECPLSDEWFKMKTIIQEGIFDALFVQFYNNPSCAGTQNNNFLDWANHIKKTASKDAKIFIGLPGSSKAAGSGYLKLSEARELVLKHKNHPSFGGVMVWDAFFGSETFSGKPFYEHMHDYACGTPASPTTSAGPAPTPTACVRSHTVASGEFCYLIANNYGISVADLLKLNPQLNSDCVVHPGDSICVKLGFPTTTSTTSSSTTSSSTTSTSTTSTSTTSSSTTSTSTTSTSTTSTSTTSSSTTSSSTTSSSTTSSSTTSETSVVTPAPETTSTSTDAATPTSTEEEDDETSTITSAPETTSTSTDAATPTSTEEDDTCEDEETTTSDVETATITSAPETTSTSTDAPTTTSTEEEDDTCEDEETTTSDVETATITSAPETTSTSSDAPATTSTEEDDTCEDDETTTSDAETATSDVETATSTEASVTGSSSSDTSANPTTTAAESFTTSTIYATTTYTITSCAPTVTDCPGTVVTKTIAISTTVCPVEPSTTASVSDTPKPTTDDDNNTAVPTTTPTTPSSPAEPTTPGSDTTSSSSSTAEELESTSTTQVTTTRFTTLVVPKPSESAPAVDDDEEEDDDDEDDDVPTVTPAPSSSFAVPTTTTAAEPSSTPTKEVVTGGAGRNAAVALPAVLAALMLVV